MSQECSGSPFNLGRQAGHPARHCPCPCPRSPSCFVRLSAGSPWRRHFRWYGCRLPPLARGVSPGSPAEFGVEFLSLQVARQFAEAPGSTGDLSGTYRIAHGLPGPEPSLEAAETPLAFVWWSP